VGLSCSILNSIRTGKIYENSHYYDIDNTQILRNLKKEPQNHTHSAMITIDQTYPIVYKEY